MCYFEEYPEETEIITFDRNEDRGIAGKADDGLIVFVDKFSYVDVKYMETWHCKLLRGPGPSQYYFAWPIDRVEKKQTAVEMPEECLPKPVAGDDSFVAVGDDRLFSKKLRAGNYVAYRSLNGMWLQLMPSDHGNIRCRDNSVAIEGLDGFVSGQFPRNLECTCREDCFLIKLEE